ncbi:tyrosine-type recombinase/integrase [Pediococcus argentinicus]|uniref:site-specific integrase n=1 Tax=Pediococcus argentinicus TaxID=480391 RepID=UPI003390014F
MTNIYKYTLKNGSTRYKFQAYTGVNPLTGKQSTTTRSGFKTKKEATIALSRLQLEIETKGSLDIKQKMLFADVYTEWHDQYINTVRESTDEKTRRIFKVHILPALGNFIISKITINQCQRLVNQWYQEAKSFKKWFNYTAMIFDFALKRGLIDKDPTKFVTVPKLIDDSGDKPANFWTRQELQTFFSLINPNTDLEKYTMFRTLAYSGVRKGELLALTWSDINFSKNTLRVNKTITQGIGGKTIVQAPKSRAGRRTIELDPITINTLRRWKLTQKTKLLELGFNANSNKQLVFSSNTNHFKSMNTPTKWLNNIIEHSNLHHISVHGFRHTHASMLYQAGVGLKETQARLGHSRSDSSTTLDVYTHTTKEQNIEALNKFERFIN